MKRTLDLCCVIIAATLLSPLYIVLALAIWLDDRGPLFFRQERIGLDFAPFRIWKFRTMRKGRVTRVGHVLRQTGLDELPQMINIFSRAMSVVGPRPLTASDIERLYTLDPETLQMWRVKPGLTGLAQLNSGRGLEVSRRFDLRYAKCRSLTLDINIIGLTLVVNIVGKRRVRRWLQRRET